MINSFDNTLFDLSGRVALVTGSSKGLGKAMARGFAEAGANIVISSRDENNLKAALSEILSGTTACGAYIVADMARRNDVNRLAAESLEKFGRVDIVVNNVGRNVPEELEEITDINWDRSIELNLTSCMALTRALLPQMKERGWGRVIHISSIMGLASKAGRSAYSGTKAALIGMARAGALELGSFGITVNCLAPGPFLSDQARSVLSEEERKQFANLTAVGRWAQPREIAGPALLLASEAGSYITGQTIVVDGGALCTTF